MHRLYFDYNAATPLAPACRELIQQLSDGMGNPSSLHQEGRQARLLIDGARDRLSELLGCVPQEITFTSGATEANNLAIRTLAQQRLSGTIITTQMEHDSVLAPIRQLEAEGRRVAYVRCERDGLDWPHLESLMVGPVAFVAVMLANNETGLLFSIPRIAELARRQGAMLHCDAACGLGKMRASFAHLGCDTLALSGEKSYALSGVGVLVAGRGVEVAQHLVGGPQEGGVRAGTENVLGIVTLPAGLSYALDQPEAENTRLWGLRQLLKTGISRLRSDAEYFEHPNQLQLPGTLNVGFPRISGRVLQARLDLEGVATSFGSACHSGSTEVSRILLALGLTKAQAEQGLRLSFGRMTTKEDVEAFLQILERVLGTMQAND